MIGMKFDEFRNCVSQFVPLRTQYSFLSYRDCTMAIGVDRWLRCCWLRCC